ncbi:MAG TPA: hypothetical protein VGN11_07435, partial [Candidatus Baltobacteraceae bacterium]|nr:hypothetical protein [Candidatus Baltobacteraceae bacterium]
MMLAAITLSVQLQRTSFDLLDGLNITVAAHNSGKAPAALRFPSPAEYAIDVLRGDDVVWTSQLPPSDHDLGIPAHAKTLMPGPTVLAVYIWNETTKDGASITPGDYTIRVRLLADDIKSQGAMRVH